MNGLDAWAEEGIAGRGVLIDYLTYAQENGIDYDCTGTHHIHTSVLTKILQATKTAVEVGDILFVRTGFVAGYKSLDRQQREALSTQRSYPGVVQSRETTEWLWEKQFAAVAADNPAFECGRKFDVSMSNVITDKY